MKKSRGHMRTTVTTLAMTLSLGALFAAPGGLRAQATVSSGPQPSTQSTQNFADVEGRAQAGDAAAQSLLATMYRSGVGVRRDYVQAVAWYRKAAEQGDPKAEEGLREMYQ